MSYTKVAQGSKLEDIPPDADQREANIRIQHNFEIIMKALNDIRARLDSQT